MKIHKYCVPNIEDRCTSCRRRHVSKTKKRVCPLYSSLKKKGAIDLYEYFVTEMTVLRKNIDELEETIQFILQHPNKTDKIQ